MTPLPQSTILVVDDHEASRYLRRRTLTHAGYRVLEAATGQRALEMVAAHRPDLVILDVQLPDIHGLEVCRRIKSDRGLAVIPVLHMSATNISAPEQVEGLKGGADGYLVEPIAPEVLVATVGALLRARRAEAAASESRRAMEVLVQNLPGAAYRCDRVGGQLTFVSGRVVELAGISPEHAASAPAGWWDLAVPEDRGVLEGVRQRAVEHRPLEFTYRIRRPDGEVRWIWDRVAPVRAENGSVLFWEGFATDNTDQKTAQDVIAREQERLEELVRSRTEALQKSHDQLRMSERLAALGTLSAGLGHDMGNLLLPMRVRLDALRGSDLPEEAQREVRAIAETCEYLRRLSDGLRLLAADSASDDRGQAVEIHEWWEEASALLRSTLPKRLELQHTLPDGPCWVRMGKTGLTQAVFNLVQNAGDAMREFEHGAVRIVARRSDDAVIVTVSDTGPGMTPEVLARCFEPFFTTKPRGLSAGLGLALVYGLVAEAHGELRVESTLGKGTVFTMRLRAAPDPAAAAPAAGRRAVEIDVRDVRLRAMIAAEARRLRCEVRPVDHPGDTPAVRVVDRADGAWTDRDKVLFVGDPALAPAGAVALGPRPRLTELRSAMTAALSDPTGGA